jgi:hypothetical protein
MSASTMDMDIRKPRVWVDGRRAFGKWKGPGWVQMRLMPGGELKTVRPAIFRALPAPDRRKLPIAFKYEHVGIGTIMGVDLDDRFEIWVEGKTIWHKRKPTK